MQLGWIASIRNILHPRFGPDSFAVVRRPRACDAGSFTGDNPPRPPIGVGHTTETRFVPRYRPQTAPVWTVGSLSPLRPGSQIVQHLPVGRFACALRNAPGGIETNRRARSQIEVVGFSAIEPWMVTDRLQRAQLASLLEWHARHLGVPERRPWPDDHRSHSLPWAVEDNYWRVNSKYGEEAGWFYHLEVPENTHWDMGSFLMRKLLEMEDLVLAYQLMAVWRTGDGHRHSEPLSRPWRTLRKLFAQTATRRVRRAVREHLSKGHSVRIAKRYLEAAAL